MKKISLFLSLFLISASQALAAGPLRSEDMSKMKSAVGKTATMGGFESSVSLGGILALLIQGFLGILGIIFIILIILAGYHYMTAQGEEEKVKKATQTIWRAIIGLMIIIAAYSITYFVFTYMPWGDSGGVGGAPVY